MILVNHPGSWEFVYPPLRHAESTDLIFPFFLFIVGVALSFSLIARAERGEPQGRLLRRVFRRSVI